MAVLCLDLNLKIFLLHLFVRYIMSFDETTACLDEHNEGGDVPDLSDWMSNLPEHLKNVSINQLAIPGSHDSGSYWLNPESPICPGKLLYILKGQLCSRETI